MLRLCIEPGCANAATSRGRCDDCRRELERERSRRRRLEKNPQRDYRVHVHHTKRWLVTRRRYLFDHPLCEQCGALAEHVHHIRALTTGGAPYDPANLAALCSRCHNAISAREQVERRRIRGERSVDRDYSAA